MIAIKPLTVDIPIAPNRDRRESIRVPCNLKKLSSTRQLKKQYSYLQRPALFVGCTDAKQTRQTEKQRSPNTRTKQIE